MEIIKIRVRICTNKINAIYVIFADYNLIFVFQNINGCFYDV